MPFPAQNLEGMRFSRLTVIRRAQNRKTVVCWECQCDCGTTKEVRGQHLLSGHTRSCGCLAPEVNGRRETKHGMHKHPIYPIWVAMNGRCSNPNNPRFKRYGGRGIQVCERWREDFSVFVQDMGPRPSSGHSIEREDNNGPYSPDNCIWGTSDQQQNNKAGCCFVVLNGERMTLKQMAKRFDIRYGTIISRHKK